MKEYVDHGGRRRLATGPGEDGTGYGSKRWTLQIHGECWECYTMQKGWKVRIARRVYTMSDAVLWVEEGTLP